MTSTRLAASFGAALCATLTIAGNTSASSAPSTSSSTAFAASMNGYYPQPGEANYPVKIYPVLQVTGTMAPYHHAKRQPNGQIGTAWNGPAAGPGNTSYGEIDCTFKSFVDLVTGSSAGVNAAKASVGNSNVVILGNPSGSSALLSIDMAGSAIMARASGAAGARKYSEVNTTAGITLAGTLIGAMPVSTPSGKLEPNTVLFDNGTMRITGNATSRTESGLEVVGLEIVMTGQDLNGTIMTGVFKFLDTQVQ